MLVEGQLDRDPELPLVEGLDDVAVRARALGAIESLLVGEGRHEDDRDFAPLAEHRGGLDAVFVPLELDVHEDEIWLESSIARSMAAALVSTTSTTQ